MSSIENIQLSFAISKLSQSNIQALYNLTFTFNLHVNSLFPM